MLTATDTSLGHDGMLTATDTGVRRDGGFHPLITGLIQALPAPGTEWDDEGRTRWLNAAKSIIDLLYKQVVIL